MAAVTATVAAPVQKPLHPEIRKMYEDYFDRCFRASPVFREWVGLTHEEIEEVWEQVESSDFRDCVHPFARAIENKLKEKNEM
jgi:hypothetical protein